MSDMLFENLLEEHNQAYVDARPFNNWMPPDGKYTVAVANYEDGAKVDSNNKTGWCRLTAKIVAGENITDVLDREFDIAFFTPNGLAALKTAAGVMNGGVEPGSLAEAVGVLRNTVGQVLNVKVETSHSQKTGRDYTNVYIEEVVATTDAATDNSEPPQG